MRLREEKEDLDQQVKNKIYDEKIINIGFDIDNTLTDETEFEFEMYQKWRTDIAHIGPYTQYRNLAGVTFLDRYPATEKIVNDQFQKWYFPLMVKEAPLRLGIKELLEELPKISVHEYRFASHIITRRDDYYEGTYSGPMMRQDTIDRFKKEGLKYDKIFFRGFNKKQTMKDNNIHILVDDEPMNIFQVSTEFPIIVANKPYNKNITGRNIYNKENVFDTDIFTGVLKDIVEEVIL